MSAPTSKDMLLMSVVQEHIGKAAEMVAEDAARNYREGLECSVMFNDDLRLESPLEAIFYVWWLACESSNSLAADWIVLCSQSEVKADGQLFRVDFSVEPRTQRLRDGVAAGKVKWPPIAIEVDGHGFHERTREQVAYRDRRDRALQKAGWRVFHYSWSEMTRRPIDCAAEVFCYAKDQYNRVDLELYEFEARNKAE